MIGFARTGPGAGSPDQAELDRLRGLSSSDQVLSILHYQADRGRVVVDTWVVAKNLAAIREGVLNPRDRYGDYRRAACMLRELERSGAVRRYFVAARSPRWMLADGK